MTLILTPEDYGENLPSELTTFTLGVNMPRCINIDEHDIIMYVDATDIDNPIEIIIKS